MALAKYEKEKIVDEVKQVVATASTLVVSDARGLKVSELSQIRKEANKKGVHIQVIKNSLAKLAFKGSDFDCTEEILTGPSLFAFSFGEPGAAAKLLKIIKEKAKPNKKEVSKEEAEKILKQSQMQEYSHANKSKEKTEKKVETKKPSMNKTKTKTFKTKSSVKKTKKVSKK